MISQILTQEPVALRRLNQDSRRLATIVLKAMRKLRGTATNPSGNWPTIFIAG
jgi:hypothetical protein